MDPYNQELLTYLLSGLIIGVGLVVWGAFHKKWMVRLLAFVVGILVIWYGLVMGVVNGFSAWQQSPDPPPEAFKDGGPMVGMLVFGWIPAGFVCLFAYGLVRWRVSAMKKSS
jgi:hypothetical protein